jgi:hypothetical protein
MPMAARTEETNPNAASARKSRTGPGLYWSAGLEMVILEIRTQYISSQIQKSNTKMEIQIQNDKTKNDANSDFSIEIHHDSYTAEVSALPPSFDFN